MQLQLEGEPVLVRSNAHSTAKTSGTDQVGNRQSRQQYHHVHVYVLSEDSAAVSMYACQPEQRGLLRCMVPNARNRRRALLAARHA
jgi:hypothetical protein